MPISLLRKGKAFNQLAQEISTDPGSKDQGGNLGWVKPESLVTLFSKAMLSLKKGEITSTPVQDLYVWHVIKLNNSRATHTSNYAEAEPQLKQMLQQQKAQEYVKSLLDTVLK